MEKKLGIICVDDEKIVIESIENLCSTKFRNYVFEFASSGEEVYEVLEEFEDESIELCLIISDYIMPEIKGDELLIDINEKYPDAKKIMLTGQSDIEAVGNVINKANLYRYISKPWENSDLILTINEAIKSYKQAKEIKEYTKNLEEKVEERTEELKKSFKVINAQMEQLQDKNRKIMESINYAKMVQNSILPDKMILDEYFSEKCIIWRPRDVVGGDLYWAKKMGDTLILCVIDCTGHGVPGAFITMTVNGAINNMLAENASIETPGEFLQSLNKKMKVALNKDGARKRKRNEVDDGLDIAVTFYKKNEQKLVYSGAKIPLYLSRADGLEIIKGNKQNIGYFRSKEDYIYDNHIIELKEGDMFFFTTDGLLDQNSSSGKMFGKDRFAALIDKNKAKKLDELELVIKQTLDDYMGEEKQRDDITVIGLRI